MHGKWILIGGCVVLVAIGAGALSLLRGPSPRAAAPAAKIAEPPAALPGEVSLPGKIEAQQVVPVGAQVMGSVAEFLVEVGQEVYAGQVLARISNQGLESARVSAGAAMELAQARADKAAAAIIAARLEAGRARADATRARAEFDRSQRAYQRQKMLHGEGATPRLVYEKAQREYEGAQAEYESLEKLALVAESRVDELLKEQESAKSVLEEKSQELEEAQMSLQSAEVHSPVDGLVVERKGEVGTELRAQEQAEMFRIAVNPAELQVTVNPDEAVWKRLHAGGAALVVIADLAGEGLPGTVKEVRENRATVAFTSPDPVVKPGMTAQVRIKLDGR
jgi:multidrug resistance efflux pump